MIRVAPEGKVFIAIAAFIAAALAWFAPWWALALWIPIFVWVIAFFRDPVRQGARGESLILAPADGVVVSIVEVEEPEFIQGPSTRIAIFMNVFDVHVNRYPASGVIEYRRYNPGKFGHAGADKASLDNEQSSVGITTPRGKLLVRQIAGLVARRIVTDHSTGTVVQQGERMGMIRFGSRVDLFIPIGARILVQPGQRTRAGLTVVATWE